MIILRSLLFQIFFIAASLWFSSLALLFSKFLTPDKLGKIGYNWAHTNLTALKIICGLTYRINYEYQLPKTTAIVFSKHQSAWDTLILWILIPPEQSWVLKRELIWIPIFGWALKCFKPIALNRAAGRRAIMQLLHEGQKLLESGRWIIIFPEGTRVPPGTHRPYSNGGALLAARTGYPIVLIAHNSGEFWGRKSLLKYPGTIDLVIGPTLDSRTYSTAELTAQAEQWIETTVARLPHRDSNL